MDLVIIPWKLLKRFAVSSCLNISAGFSEGFSSLWACLSQWSWPVRTGPAVWALTVGCEDSHAGTKAHSIPVRHTRPQAGLGRPAQLRKFWFLSSRHGWVLDPPRSRYNPWAASAEACHRWLTFRAEPRDCSPAWKLSRVVFSLGSAGFGRQVLHRVQRQTSLKRTLPRTGTDCV